MPNKDPLINKERQRLRLQELRKDPEKWAKFMEKKRAYARNSRLSETKEEREERLAKRREWLHKSNPNYKPRIRFTNEEERRAYERKYHREYARKVYANDPDGSYAKYREYWANTTPERKAKRRAKQTEYTKKSRELYPELTKSYYLRSQAEWTTGIKCLDPAIWKTAESKAMELAVRLGYTDIFQPGFDKFYFDFAARKDGRITVFQVTTLRRRLIKFKHIELARYLGLDYFIVHVRPTLDIAFITQISTDPLPTTKSVAYLYRRGTVHYL